MVDIREILKAKEMARSVSYEELMNRLDIMKAETQRKLKSETNGTIRELM